jgi:hypothetical protein
VLGVLFGILIRVRHVKPLAGGYVAVSTCADGDDSLTVISTYSIDIILYAATFFVAIIEKQLELLKVYLCSVPLDAMVVVSICLAGGCY